LKGNVLAVLILKSSICEILKQGLQGMHDDRVPILDQTSITEQAKNEISFAFDLA